MPVHQLTNKSELKSYCLPTSSKEVRNNPNFTTDDMPLTIKDKYKKRNPHKINH